MLQRLSPTQLPLWGISAQLWLHLICNLHLTSILWSSYCCSITPAASLSSHMLIYYLYLHSCSSSSHHITACDWSYQISMQLHEAIAFFHSIPYHCLIVSFLSYLPFHPHPHSHCTYLITGPHLNHEYAYIMSPHHVYKTIDLVLRTLSSDHFIFGISQSKCSVYTLHQSQ